MAIRNIVHFGDERLTKKCRVVTEIDNRIITLLEDMEETLKDSNGVGLAAPQVGVLKRIAIIDVGEGVIDLINPEIIEKSEDETEDLEGCLSLPGKYGYVTRPNRVKVRAMNRKGEIYELEGEGLLARALCHETEHLDGILYTTHVTRFAEVEED